MKLLWLGYLVYSLGNCAIKLCIETGLMREKYFLLTEKICSYHLNTFGVKPSYC